MSTHQERTKRAKVAAWYVTTGCIMAGWAALWLIYQIFPNTFTIGTFLACGVLFTGVTLAVVGLRMGKIVKGANEDDEEEHRHETARAASVT